MKSAKNFLAGAFSLMLVALTISLLYQPVTAVPPPGPKLRSYYLTTATHNGSQALRGCASGFHMASLWEIHDTSNLEYDTTLGLTHPDSGSGPPSGVNGWVRTGGGAPSLGICAPGVITCEAWTSSAGNRQGTVVSLADQWVGEPSLVAPWAGTCSVCNSFEPVWCVQD
ncbi:MAG: hypothetical protein ACRD5I_00505 [Candidatus Acidiferrales bacterium]